MSMMARNKGKEGEREAAKILTEIIGGGVVIQRNLFAQARDGGTDLTGLNVFAVEVKRCQSLSVPTWWKQTCAQTADGRIPLLMYRQNKKPWTFVLPRDCVRVPLCDFDNPVKLNYQDAAPIIQRIERSI